MTQVTEEMAWKALTTYCALSTSRHPTVDNLNAMHAALSAALGGGEKRKGAAARILKGLLEAMDGDFAAVNIDGVRWVRFNPKQRVTMVDESTVPNLPATPSPEDDR